jgi:hypothetical protein
MCTKPSHTNPQPVLPSIAASLLNHNSDVLMVTSLPFHPALTRVILRHVGHLMTWRPAQFLKIACNFVFNREVLKWENSKRHRILSHSPRIGCFTNTPFKEPCSIPASFCWLTPGAHNFQEACLAIDTGWKTKGIVFPLFHYELAERTNNQNRNFSLDMKLLRPQGHSLLLPPGPPLLVPDLTERPLPEATFPRCSWDHAHESQLKSWTLATCCITEELS